MTRDTGGPAYPVTFEGGQNNGETPAYCEGMTLRDWFAGQALAASCNKRFVAGPGESAAILQAEWAYLIADVMLEARK